MRYQPSGQRNLPASFTLPTYRPDRLTHILLGDYAAVIWAINRMEVLRYYDVALSPWAQAYRLAGEPNEAENA